MNRTILAVASFFLASTAQAAAPSKPALKTDDQKSFYIMGASFGQKIADLGLTNSELEYVSLGMRDIAQGRQPAVDPQIYNAKLETMLRTRLQTRAAAEKAKSEVFLKKAAEEKGAVKTGSGLVYVLIQPGDGASPTPDQGVKLHYKSTLPNGMVLEDTHKRGTPAEFTHPVSELIPCWQEALPKLKVGGKMRAVCPSSLTYGDVGNPMAGVPGGSAVVFEFELLDVLKAQKEEAPKNN